MTFRTVYLAKWRGTNVAIKMMNNYIVGDASQKASKVLTVSMQRKVLTV
jgi:hypothetical protein